VEAYLGPGGWGSITCPNRPRYGPLDIEARRKVHRDGHVEFDRAYYSVPPEYFGREVWVRAEARMVRIFNQRMEVIGAHVRVEPGRITEPEWC
jgi:hypothetical protein